MPVPNRRNALCGVLFLALFFGATTLRTTPAHAQGDDNMIEVTIANGTHRGNLQAVALEFDLPTLKGKEAPFGGLQ
jgi:hypothetical protein